MTPLRKYSLIALAIILGVLGLMYFTATHLSYSDGERAGMVVKLSRKGNIVKTYEGELNVGGIGGSNMWQFSVDGDKTDPIVVGLEDALTKGIRVKVHYEERYWSLPWKGDTKYFITEVQPVGK